MTGKKKNHYVDSKKLLAHLIERRRLIDEAEANGTEPPPLEKDRYLGETIWAICYNLSYHPSFMNYSFKNDMISDAVENLVRVVDNFNPNAETRSKYPNPFGYFTTIAWYAMARRIQIEEKQQLIKGAIISEMNIDDLFDTQEIDDDGVEYKTHFIHYLRENNFLAETEKEEKKKKKSPVVVRQGLEEFYEDEEGIPFVMESDLND